MLKEKYLTLKTVFAHTNLNVAFVSFQGEQISVEFRIQGVQMVNVQGLACVIKAV